MPSPRIPYARKTHNPERLKFNYLRGNVIRNNCTFEVTVFGVVVFGLMIMSFPTVVKLNKKNETNENAYNLHDREVWIKFHWKVKNLQFKLAFISMFQI